MRCETYLYSDSSVLTGLDHKGKAFALPLANACKMPGSRSVASTGDAAPDTGVSSHWLWRQGQAALTTEAPSGTQPGLSSEGPAYLRQPGRARRPLRYPCSLAPHREGCAHLLTPTRPPGPGHTAADGPTAPGHPQPAPQGRQARPARGG